jgi:hypothetical protein
VTTDKYRELRKWLYRYRELRSDPELIAVATERYEMGYLATKLQVVCNVETRLDTTLRSSQGNQRRGGRRLEVLTCQLTPYAED